MTEDPAPYLMHRGVGPYGTVYSCAWMDRWGDLRAFDVHTDKLDLPREAEDRFARARIEEWLARHGPALGPLVPVPFTGDANAGL